MIIIEPSAMTDGNCVTVYAAGVENNPQSIISCPAGRSADMTASANMPPVSLLSRPIAILHRSLPVRFVSQSANARAKSRTASAVKTASSPIALPRISVPLFNLQ